MNYNIGRVDKSTSHVEITFPMVADMFARSENIQHLFQYPIVSSHLGIFHGLRTYALRFFPHPFNLLSTFSLRISTQRKLIGSVSRGPQTNGALRRAGGLASHRPLGCRHRHNMPPTSACHARPACHASLASSAPAGQWGPVQQLWRNPSTDQGFPASCSDLAQPVICGIKDDFARTSDVAQTTRLFFDMN